MNLVNGTRFLVAYTMGLDPDAREHIVVVAKGTFSLPSGSTPLELSAEQVPFVFADTFSGEPGLSAVLHESEFALRKPRCDVLLVGSAHAPGGHPTTRVPVGLRVGAMKKDFEVLGDRYWTSGITGITPSRPAPFGSMPITYNRAFGGGDESASTPGLRNAYPPNPVGVGYFKELSDENVLGHPVPNSQDPRDPVLSPRGSYRPMSFGVVGRNFAPRYPLAGTYDERWLEEKFPFLPSNFSFEYFQSAPLDQQVPYPTGGEVVQLFNLSPSPIPPFELPAFDIPIEFTDRSFQRSEVSAALDTIILEPDLGRMQLLWRASLPLRRNIQEIVEVVVGRMPRGWYRARKVGKKYVPSLGMLASSRTEES